MSLLLYISEAGTASKSRTISDTSKSSRPTKLVREPSQPDGSGAKAGDAGRHSFSGVEGDGAGVGVGVGRDGRDRSNGPRERERAWSYDHISMSLPRSTAFLQPILIEMT